MMFFFSLSLLIKIPMWEEIGLDSLKTVPLKVVCTFDWLTMPCEIYKSTVSPTS